MSRISQNEKLIQTWFSCWENGKPEQIPVTEDFSHQSPFGVTESKASYLELVNANRDKFLGHKFNILDMICSEDHACIRYEAIQGDHTLEVSEWYYFRNDLIEKVIAYYHIGEIRDERKLEKPGS